MTGVLREREEETQRLTRTPRDEGGELGVTQLQTRAHQTLTATTRSLAQTLPPAPSREQPRGRPDPDLRPLHERTSLCCFQQPMYSPWFPRAARVPAEARRPASVQASSPGTPSSFLLAREERAQRLRSFFNYPSPRQPLLWIPCELIPGFTHNYPLSFHVYQCGHPQLG